VTSNELHTTASNDPGRLIIASDSGRSSITTAVSFQVHRDSRYRKSQHKATRRLASVVASLGVIA